MNTSPHTDSPRVSILIPTYNCAAYLPAAIDSALMQDYPAMEILICDDGSTDNTVEVLARYGDRIHVIAGEHRGVSAARNKLIGVATGELIAPLDADDIWPAGKLERQVRVMHDRPAVGLVHTACEMFGGETGDGPITEERRRRIDGSCFEAQFFQTGIMPSSCLLRRSALPAHGFYEDMPNAEDYALFLQVLWDHEASYLGNLVTQIRRRPGQATEDRGQRLQVYNGLARLRALEYLRDRMPPEQHDRLKGWALEELEKCAYSRYWRGDHAIAERGFAILERFGRPVPTRHRLRARVGSWWQQRRDPLPWPKLELEHPERTSLAAGP